MRKKSKKKVMAKKIVIEKNPGFKVVFYDIVFKAAAICAAALILGLAYTGIRKTFVPANKTPDPVVESVVVQVTPVPANTPVIIKKTVIAAKYRHLMNPVKTKTEIPKIHMEEAKALLESGKAVFVDARGFSEYEAAHIKDAISIPAGTPQDKIKESADNLKDKVLITYCHGIGCHLSDKTAYTLFDAGYRKINIFFGGWNEWTQAGLPVDEYKPPQQYEPLFKDAASLEDIREITLDEAKFLYDKNFANFIDVDYQDNYNKIHIDRAVSLAFDKLDQLIPLYAELFRQKPVVIYCHGIGRKAKAASQKIYSANNKKVLIFVQALPQWEKAGYPLYRIPAK